MRWWISHGGEPEGPFPQEHIIQWLRSRQLSSDALACPEGGQQWRPLNQIAAFAPYVQPHPAPAAVLSPGQAAGETDSTPRRPRRTLPAHAECIQCGCSLYGQPADGVCPECGTAVSESYRPDRTSGLAVASMILGIVSIPTCVIEGIPSLVCGILAVVFASKAEKQIRKGQAAASSRGMAKAGFVCGWIGISLSIVVWFVAFLIGFELGLEEALTGG